LLTADTQRPPALFSQRNDLEDSKEIGNQTTRNVNFENWVLVQNPNATLAATDGGGFVHIYPQYIS
jgi:hypothetical protein